MFTRRALTYGLLCSVALLGLPAADAAGNGVAVHPNEPASAVIAAAGHVVPSPVQLRWQRRELTAFIHYGPNTYTGLEIGTGTESPNIVAPHRLDTDQWVRVLKNAGFSEIMLVTKHHDGLVLWPTRYSHYSVKYSTWRDGKGDIVGDFVKSAHKYGMAVAFYLSPADIHEGLAGGTYANGSKPKPVTIPTLVPGDTRRPARTFHFVEDDYNAYYMNTLYELLTQYGPVDEFFFDGFNPLKDRKQHYAFDDWYKLVRALQPNAAMFGGPDVNWVGNEDGYARETQWSVVPFTAPPVPTQATHVLDPADPDAGNRASLVDPKTRLIQWYPSLCDARLEKTWFWHPDQPPKSLDDLEKMYYGSVGRNCVLILDVPPDQHGRFDDADVVRLGQFGAWLRAHLTHDLAAHVTSAPSSDGTVYDLHGAVRFQTIGLRENIAAGQRIEEFTVDADAPGGGWQQVAHGTTIGARRLLRLDAPATAHRLRLRILQSRATPEPVRLALYL